MKMMLQAGQKVTVVKDVTRKCHLYAYIVIG